MILNICTDDWANFAYDNHKAMQAVGMNSLCVKLKAHDFGYKEQAKVVSVDRLKELIYAADIVQVFHSDKWMRQYTIGKRVIVYHTGTLYRRHHSFINDHWRDAALHVVCLGEFWKLAPKNKTYIVGAMELDEEFTDCIHPIKIAHYPSSPKIKGTNKIINMISGLSSAKYYFCCDTNQVEYNNQLDRMSDCDVYIEMFQMMLAGKEYGSWGITALEAACMGKIVVTNGMNQDVYKDHYGDCALQIVNTEDAFRDKIKELINMSSDQLKGLQIYTKKWVSKHSYLATGKKIKAIHTEIS